MTRVWWQKYLWLFMGLLINKSVGVHHRVPATEQGQAGAATESKIPRILHYIYLSGFEAYVAETERPRAKMQRRFYNSCVEVHKHWEIKFWTEDTATALVTEHFPDFLPVWKTYDMEVKRADAVRAFILLHHGGLYLDLDNECYRPAETAFKDYDVVLQGTGFEGVNNGMMASAPGHPLWKRVVETMRERYKGSTTDPWKNNPIYMTGPAVLTYSVQKYFKLEGPVSGFLGTTYNVDNTVVKIYSIGEFFVPCWATDLVCIKRFEKDKAAGKWDMSKLVGRHWFVGSWNKPGLLNKGGQPKERTLLEAQYRQQVRWPAAADRTTWRVTLLERSADRT